MDSEDEEKQPLMLGAKKLTSLKALLEAQQMVVFSSSPAFNCFLRRALRFLDRGDRERAGARVMLAQSVPSLAQLVSVSLALKKAVSARNLRKRMKGGHGNRVYAMKPR
jgi:hypothetical protein